MALIAVFSCSVFCASEPEKIETISCKVILESSNGYFVLSDRSCWKVMGFWKRWRSLGEWWNGVELVPKNYECLPNDWYLGTQIQVYSKYDNLEVDEANASNQEALKQCTHLLVNTRTGQVLFAIALEPSTCMVQLFNEANNEGYNRGYNEGRLKCHQNANDIYKNGHADGYKAGYTEGFKAAFRGEELQH
jgi:hypothetical protein